MSDYRTSLVYLDAFEDDDPNTPVKNAFPCQIHQSSRGWNGWAEPLFDRQTAERIVRINEQTREKLITEGFEPDCLVELRFEGDDIVMLDHSYLDETGHPERQIIQAGESGLYGIGTSAWTWSEMESHEIEHAEPSDTGPGHSV